MAIGAIAALLIAFSGHPAVQWIVTAAIALAGFLLYLFFPAYLQAAERTREKHEQGFRQRRFRRWQKTAEIHRPDDNAEGDGA